VFLVSHDRAFVDAVATSILAYEGTPESPGQWREFEGNVQDWLVQSARSRASQAASATTPPSATTLAPATPTPTASATATPAPAKSRTKLSYKDQRELDELPDRIDALEAEHQQVRDALADGSLFATDPERAQALCNRDAEIEAALMHALERWELLSQGPHHG
jgi:ATP-binding cassette subfamily F protein uup